MTTLRAFTCDDLFRFNNINLDPLTETYGIPFYLQYLAHWPEYFIVAEAPGGELMGYKVLMLCMFTVMGKAEGSVAREEWHGHVTALSVAPEFRRLGLAAKLMELLEEISEKAQRDGAKLRQGKFRLDVRKRLFTERVVGNYNGLSREMVTPPSPSEFRRNMRKALSRDTEKKSVIPLPHPVRPEDIE
ncbi:NAA20 acetyltransferase, partial [Piprites chloris]|nr:NAA20 acetyltransferase [Piprites chloris]